MTGIEFVQALQSGSVAPSTIALTMGWRITAVASGRVEFMAAPAAHLLNHGESLHGGAMATMLDGVMSAAATTLMSRGEWITTIELKTSFLGSPRMNSDELRLTGQVVHRGGTLCATEGRIEGADGKLYCHATATFLVKRSNRLAKSAS